MDDRQRADENERLRRLAAEELSTMREELNRVLGERMALHRDLNELAKRLVEQEGRAVEAEARAEQETAALRAELAQTRKSLSEALSRPPVQLPAPNLGRQLLNLVPARVRRYVKRVGKAALPGSRNAR